MLLVLDGCDGAGKATQSAILAKRLDAALFSFPRYLTSVGAAIKRHLTGAISLREEHSIDSSDHTIDGMIVHRTAPEDALVFQALNLIDKYDAATTIRTLLANGQHVVCDRWIPSSLCYGAADGLDRAWLESIHSSLPVADLNILLDISPEEALRRRPEAGDRYEKDREKQAVVRANYEALWKEGMHQDPRKWAVVSSEWPIEDVAELVWEVVANKLAQ